MEDQKEIEFTTLEIVRMVSILNSMPCGNRGEWRLIDRLAGLLELTDTEKLAANWQELPSPDGQMNYSFKASAPVVRSLVPKDCERIGNIVQNPPEQIPWRRFEKALRMGILSKLGVAEDE